MQQRQGRFYCARSGSTHSSGSSSEVLCDLSAALSWTTATHCLAFETRLPQCWYEGADIPCLQRALPAAPLALTAHTSTSVLAETLLGPEAGEPGQSARFGAAEASRSVVLHKGGGF